MRGTLPPARPARVTTRPAARGAPPFRNSVRTIRGRSVLVPTLFHVESSVGKCGSLLHCNRVYKLDSKLFGVPAAFSNWGSVEKRRELAFVC